MLQTRLNQPLMTKPIDETPAENSTVNAAPLLGQLRQLIAQARTQALCKVDSIQVRACWEIGRHMVAFKQDGRARTRSWQTAVADAGRATGSTFR